MYENGIEMFPTMKLFKDGMSSTYKGELKADAVIQWAEAKLKQKAVVVAESGADAVAKSSGAVLVVAALEAHLPLVHSVAFDSPKDVTVAVYVTSGPEKVGAWVAGGGRLADPFGRGRPPCTWTAR
jgi:hypothetical protein